MTRAPVPAIGRAKSSHSRYCEYFFCAHQHTRSFVHPKQRKMPASKHASKKRASKKHASKHGGASKPASKRASKPASKRMSKPASKPASKRVSKRGGSAGQKKNTSKSPTQRYPLSVNATHVGRCMRCGAERTFTPKEYTLTSRGVAILIGVGTCGHNMTAIISRQDGVKFGIKYPAAGKQGGCPCAYASAST